MSLLVWLPLINNTENKGLANTVITTTGTISYSTGKLGNALTFNNSALILNPTPINTTTQEFSFAFWYKPTAMSGWQCFYNGRIIAGGAVALFLSGDNKWRFDDGAQRLFNFGATLNEWHHFAFVKNSTNVNLYIDGVLKETLTSQAITCEVTYASIGLTSYNSASASGNPVTGQLQDFRIYNHCLSKKEVKEISKGLYMHLPLDWSGNPNMIKNSYTWMNKNLGGASGSSSHTNRKVYWDDTAPSPWVFTDDLVSNADTAKVSGDWYYYGAQGVALSDLTENEYYTYSFWARSTTGNNNGLNAGSICESQTKISDSGFGALTNAWRKHTVTFKFTKTDKLTCCFYCSVPVGATVNFQVCGLKLEKGSVATPYIPHVEETIYTTNNYGSIYYEDDSGYNHDTSPYGVNNVPCTAPRGITGTTCGSDSCIILGKSIKLQCPISFAFWFNTSNLTNNNNRLISCTEGGGWNVELSGNYLCWTTGTGASSNTYKYCISTKTYTELQNAWHHIVCTYDGLKAQMYIDGVLNKETVHYTTFTPIFYNANNSVFLCAEASRNAVPQTFTTDTSVSDFRFYATILTADDVKELYQVGAQIDKNDNFYCGQLVEV